MAQGTQAIVSTALSIRKKRPSAACPRHISTPHIRGRDAPCASFRNRLRRDNHDGMASWRSGDAADCKSVYTGSIPVLASTQNTAKSVSYRKRPAIRRVFSFAPNVLILHKAVKRTPTCSDFPFVFNDPTRTFVSAEYSGVTSFSPSRLQRPCEVDVAPLPTNVSSDL